MSKKDLRKIRSMTEKMKREQLMELELVKQQRSIIASGGLCKPLDADYDIVGMNKKPEITDSVLKEMQEVLLPEGPEPLTHWGDTYASAIASSVWTTGTSVTVDMGAIPELQQQIKELQEEVFQLKCDLAQLGVTKK